MSTTPAPWRGFPNVSGSNPSKRAVVAGDYVDEGEPDMLVEVWASDEEVDANARLIAGAPEMLAALEAAKYALKELSYHAPHGSDEYDLGGDVYSQIDDALAKARGESQ